MSGFRNRNRVNHALRSDSGSEAVNVTLNDEMNNNIRLTEALGKNQKTRNDYNNRIMKMINWMKNKMQAGDIIANESDLIRELLEHEKNDKINYHKSTHDFVYENLPSSITKSFLSDPAQKYKKRRSENEPLKQYGYDHIRKYHDSIMYGANRAGKRLPIGYGQDMKKFLDSLKKSKVIAKKNGEMDEQDADPINFSFYEYICQYSIAMGDIFFWAYTVTMWNCLSRCINIDDLQFHNITMATDSGVIEFDSTKMDGKGEKTTPKNIYANPNNYNMCIFTAFGVYFSLTDEEWNNASKKHIFILSGAETGTASSRYCKKMIDFVQTMEERVKEHIRPDHCNPYGIRKGSSTHATSGTTVPPPLTSVFLRGEWSMGVVQDIYWKFCQIGDQYLGRVMAGVDPNSSTFDTLPPHFVKGLEDENIKEAFDMSYSSVKKVLSDQNMTNFSGFLLRCLASVVYHSNELKKVARSNPRHIFNSMAILNDNVLLEKLKKLVTTKNSSRLSTRTGVPPHVETLKKLDTVMNLLLEERQSRKIWQENFQKLLKDAVNSVAEDAGQITRPKMIEIMNEHGKILKESFRDDVENVIKKHFGRSNSTILNEGSTEIENNDNADNTNCMHKTYTYGGKLGWHVCEGWEFPSCQLKQAWRFWLKGQPDFENDVNNQIAKSPIRPFRLFSLRFLPRKIKKTYQISWAPILKLMESSAEIGEIDSDGSKITDDFVRSTFLIGKNYVLSQVEYVKSMKKMDSWTISTWNMRIRRNSIVKHGTEADKERIGPAGKVNQPHREKRTFSKSNAKLSKKIRIDRAMNYLNSVSSDKNASTNSSETIEEKNCISILEDSSDADVHADRNIEKRTIYLSQNSIGQFPSVACETCDSNMPTSHRCTFECDSGDYVYNDVRICGKAFCCACLEGMDSDDNTRCPIHQQLAQV